MTEKQRLFCEWYAVTKNATQSAIKAGYKERSAYSQGCRLLKNAEIQKCIQSQIEQMKSDIPDKTELLKFWSTVMRDPEEKTSNRLAASINIAKSLFMFNADIARWE